MLASLRLRFVAIYFRRPPEVPRRQVKPWSQKIELSTWLDPPIQTYNDAGPSREGGNHNMAEVGRFFRIEANVRRSTKERRSGPLGALGLRVRRGDLQTAGIGR